MTFLKNFFIFRPSCCLWDRCTQAKDIYLDVWCLITCRPLWRVSPPTSSPGSFGLGLLILLRPTWTGSSPRSASSIGTNRPEQGESTGVTWWKLMSSDVPGCQGQSSLGPDRYFRPWSRGEEQFSWERRYALGGGVSVTAGMLVAPIFCLLFLLQIKVSVSSSEMDASASLELGKGSK